MMNLGKTGSRTRPLPLNGIEYDEYFEKPLNSQENFQSFGSVFSTLDNIKHVSDKYHGQTRQIAQKLKAESVKETSRNIYNFLYKHFAYKEDASGSDTVRTPNRSWSERLQGIDCDCFSALASCILMNLGIDHKIRMADYGDGWQHVYVVVMAGKSEIVIDAVLDEFNVEEPCIKYDVNMKTLVLNGAPNGLGKRKGWKKWGKRFLGAVLGGVIGGPLGTVLGEVIIDIVWPGRTTSGAPIQLSDTELATLKTFTKDFERQHPEMLRNLLVLKSDSPDQYSRFVRAISAKVTGEPAFKSNAKPSRSSIRRNQRAVSKNQSLTKRGLRGVGDKDWIKEQGDSVKQQGNDYAGGVVDDVGNNIGQGVSDWVEDTYNTIMYGDAPAGGLASSPGLLFPVRELKLSHVGFTQNMGGDYIQRFKRLLRMAFPEFKHLFNSTVWWNENHDAAAKQIGIWDDRVGGINEVSFNYIFGARKRSEWKDAPNRLAAIAAATQSPVPGKTTIKRSYSLSEVGRAVKSSVVPFTKALQIVQHGIDPSTVATSTPSVNGSSGVFGILKVAAAVGGAILLLND